MTHDDVLFGYRLRLFTLAEELGSVSGACRQMGVARSTYYAWKRRLKRYGLDGLRVRERRRPRMPNLFTRPPGLRTPADLGRARPTEVGWDLRLRARRLAGAAAF